MHILVTRPEPDARDLQALLEGLGHEVTVSPLIEIVDEPLPPDVLDKASGLIVTSQNALRSLEHAGLAASTKTLPVYAVGEATARLATAMGMTQVIAGSGTGRELATTIAQRHAAPQGGRSGPLVHLCGDHLAFDLGGALAFAGFTVRAVPAYRSVAIKNLSPQLVAALTSNNINAVMLMSPRTAAIWTTLTDKHGLQTKLGNLTHVCLSPAVAARLHLSPSPPLAIAREPRLEEMLVLIKGLAAHPARE